MILWKCITKTKQNENFTKKVTMLLVKISVENCELSFHYLFMYFVPLSKFTFMRPSQLVMRWHTLLIESSDWATFLLIKNKNVGRASSFFLAIFNTRRTVIVYLFPSWKIEERLHSLEKEKKVGMNLAFTNLYTTFLPLNFIVDVLLGKNTFNLKISSLSVG